MLKSNIPVSMMAFSSGKLLPQSRTPHQRVASAASPVSQSNLTQDLFVGDEKSTDNWLPAVIGPLTLKLSLGVHAQVLSSFWPPRKYWLCVRMVTCTKSLATVG